MATLLRWLIRIAGTLILLSLLIVLAVYYLASRSLPEYNKTLSAQGLVAPIEIVRDHANVPHILGQTDTDSFFGLGYAHAQDRLWQMVTLRRTAQGRLSEVFGPRMLDVDRLMRRLDLHGLARESLPDLKPDTRAILDAYAAGVNARMAEINRDALGRGAPEMFIFNAAIAPWNAADSVALIKLMALQLTGHLNSEVLRARTSLRLADPSRIVDILPDAPGAGIARLPDYAALLPDQARPLEFAARPAPKPIGPLSPFHSLAHTGASNAFAAAPTRSAAGGTLLAADPHLGFSAPSIWYLARIELAAGGVIGGSIPGIPAIMTGRNADLGWGLTASYLDDQDLHIEEINPQNPNEYRTPEGFKPFKTRKSIIEIKDSAPMTITLRWTDNGPVLPAGDFNLGIITPAGHVMSLNWTGLSGDDTSMDAVIGLMRAKSVRAAIDAGAAMVSPSLNLMLADREEIAMKTIGAMPRRDANHQSQGRLPSRGWRPENRWQGLLPYRANPEFVAPQGGLLGNTNNKMVERPFPMHLSFEWGDTQRIRRLERLMKSREIHTRDSFIEAQLDSVSYSARAVLPLIGADLWYTGEAAPAGTPERLRQRALELLANWNGEMNEHMPEPLIYAAWVRMLQARLIQDDLGPLAKEYTHVDPLFLERVFRDIDGAAQWCDVAQSTPIETCSDVSRMALDDALIWISERYGTHLESLRWGDVHQATHDHPVLGEVPLLRYFVNIRQSTSGGDNTLMRGLTSGAENDPFENVHGAGYRGVYDFADPDSSVFVISTGQSGHFLSRHYDDLAQLWRRGEYIPMSLDVDLARAAATGVTVINPQ
ncbi:penicillin acylase family protein [Litorivita pollutaquae]|uniref:Penicillin acylase family protein n=1 Tax=Litorivita pollutaquae TaxID=2200892 RepID=A0A2V4MNM9_9RHOB|nr:penicillin acylase family protein [Litorivita pollutaquae]PYC48335.1 penicillin acylase family protein [Litorivita pollutaquae]